MAPEKAEIIRSSCLEILSKNGGTPNQISKLVGKLENASLISKFGRARLFHLSRLLAKFGPIFGLDGNEKTGHVSIDAGCIEELKFWAEIQSHPIQDFSRPKRSFFSTVSSDASGSRWAYVYDGIEVGDRFPADLLSASINQKEAYALFRLVDGLSRPGSSLSVMCDNQAVVSSFSKTRSRSEDIHQWVLKTQKILVEKDMCLDVKWIPTELMAQEGFADASRGRFSRATLGLSRTGVDLVGELIPEVKKAVRDKILVNLFCGPANNIFQSHYCSLHKDLADELCLKMDAFEFLRRPGKKFSWFFSFQPPESTNQVLQALRASDLQPGSNLVMLAEGRFLGEILVEFRRFGHVSHWKFNGPDNKSLFHEKPGVSFCLIWVRYGESH